MLRKSFQSLKSTLNITTIRALSSNKDNGDKLKDKDILTPDLAEALDSVTTELHGNDKERKKKTKIDILSRLTQSAKESFDTATSHETSEFLHDRQMIALLNDLEVKSEPKSIHKFQEIRRDTQAVAALRKEIFYQAIQSGVKNLQAQKLAEDVVSKAEEKLKSRREAKESGLKEEKIICGEKATKTSEQEAKFFNMAYEWMEKNLYSEQDPSAQIGQLPNEVKVDTTLPNIFNQTTIRWNIFNHPEQLQKRTLGLWDNFEMEKAKLTNQSMGPRNMIEQQIEWTKQGKLWSYPIDNEAQIGPEQSVPFYEHIFLERYLSKYKLPKTGPIPHFMELVCVGLSKNPYMTSSKKHDHLDWFGQFFDKKRQDSVAKLHEQEQIAAANAN
uniref:28S ribosomal protein S31, mitochondrial n=1 Tax=Rhabditophanes sp. KR3021 TaxID=114890 RepID=A0AC35TTQ3_9BILA